MFPTKCKNLSIGKVQTTKQKIYMAMVVGKGVQNGLAFGDKWVARETQLKTIIVKLFLWSFEYSTVVYGFVEHPPGTILSIILRAKQLAVHSRLYSFDLLIDNISLLS